MTFTNAALEEYLGQEVTKVTICNVPDISDISKKWLPQFFLNSVFRVRFNRPQHQMVLNYLRKTETALSEYSLGRDALGKYVSTDNSVITPYFDALSHFEISISYGYQALELLMILIEYRLFESGDGSDGEKLNLIYNKSKHLNKEIRRNEFPIEHTGPLWLSNDGLESQGVSFSFEKMKELMEDLAKYAEFFTVKVPNNKIQASPKSGAPD